MIIGIVLALMAIYSFRYAGTFANDQLLFDNAVKESPNSSYTNMYAGWAAFQKNDFDKAQFLYEKAIALNPSLMNVQEQLAFIYYNKKEYALAEKHILDIMRKDPTYVNGYFRLGEVYYSQARYLEAKKMFQKDFELTKQRDSAEYLKRLKQEHGI